MWQEVYLSALLRAILYADDANYVSPTARAHSHCACQRALTTLILLAAPCWLPQARPCAHARG